MSDEQRNEEQPTEVEAHAEGLKHDEPADDGDSEVEAHVQRAANVRMDSPSNT